MSGVIQVRFLAYLLDTCCLWQVMRLVRRRRSHARIICWLVNKSAFKRFSICGYAHQFPWLCNILRFQSPFSGRLLPECNTLEGHVGGERGTRIVVRDDKVIASAVPGSFIITWDRNNEKYEAESIRNGKSNWKSARIRWRLAFKALKSYQPESEIWTTVTKKPEPTSPHRPPFRSEIIPSSDF